MVKCKDCIHSYTVDGIPDEKIGGCDYPVPMWVTTHANTVCLDVEHECPTFAPYQEKGE